MMINMNPAQAAVHHNLAATASSIMLDAANRLTEEAAAAAIEIQGWYLKDDCDSLGHRALTAERVWPCQALAKALRENAGSSARLADWADRLEHEEYVLVKQHAPQSIRTMF